MNRVLVTGDEESGGLIQEELRRSGLTIGQAKLQDNGDAVLGRIYLVETKQPFEEFSPALDAYGSHFIRHVTPVDYELELQGDESDIQTICALAGQIASRMEPGKRFSVQARILGVGKLPFRKVILNETLSLALESATGSEMDCRWPEQVISILCTPTKAYIGLSNTALNRSEWPGGMQRFKREDGQVSRSEFKLLEAMSIFGVELPSKGRALDIGASPGGWSRVLAERGLTVEAVDPADLDPRLEENARITHIRRRIQEYSPSSNEFEVIVNDMKMDARDSIEIMLDFSRRLSREGIAVITLKMPKSGIAKVALDMLGEDLRRLSTGYEIIGARQLFHNRSEVTVVLKAR